MPLSDQYPIFKLISRRVEGGLLDLSGTKLCAGVCLVGSHSQGVKKKKRKNRGGKVLWRRESQEVSGASKAKLPECKPALSACTLGTAFPMSQKAQQHGKPPGSARVEHHLLIIISVLKLNNKWQPPPTPHKFPCKSPSTPGNKWPPSACQFF